MHALTLGYYIINKGYSSKQGGSKQLLSLVFPPSHYILSIQLSPDYVGIELGIGESILIKAIGESTGRGLSVIKADLKREGDLGLVAMVRHNSFSLSIA